MVNQIVNVLIAGVVGAVAFIAVRALVLAEGTACCGDALSVGATSNNTTVAVAGSCGIVVCPWNQTPGEGLYNASANCSYGGDIYLMNSTITGACPQCWSGAECTMMVTILPLAIAIFTVVLLFVALTRVRGT